MIWETSHRTRTGLNLVDLKKKVDKISEFFFENPPPPQENLRSAPSSYLHLMNALICISEFFHLVNLNFKINCKRDVRFPFMVIKFRFFYVFNPIRLSALPTNVSSSQSCGKFLLPCSHSVKEGVCCKFGNKMFSFHVV